MTKIAVAGPASGTGTFTLTAPVSSSDRTLTLPDSTGTVLNDQSNIEAQVKTATNASGSAPIYSCRAWCNFNGTTTPPTIRASGNVSSVTRNSTGEYTVNFATAMPDANYAHDAQASFSNTGNVNEEGKSYDPQTSSVRVRTSNNAAANGAGNADEVRLTVFR